MGCEIVQATIVLGPCSGTADGVVDVGRFHCPTPTTKLAQVVVLPPTLKVSMFCAPGTCMAPAVPLTCGEVIEVG